MGFYNCESEQAQLKRWSAEAANGQSSLTLMVGHRRVGKTVLLQQTYKNEPALYLFVSRKAESLLCEEFTEQIRTQLNIPVFGEPRRLREVLDILFKYAQSQSLTLILDEFQDIARVNNSVFSELQNLWDQYRDSMNMHLICCG